MNHGTASMVPVTSLQITLVLIPFHQESLCTFLLYAHAYTSCPSRILFHPGHEYLQFFFFFLEHLRAYFGSRDTVSS